MKLERTDASGPPRPFSGGKRFCGTCKEITPHTSTEVISPSGRVILVGAFVILAVFCTHICLYTDASVTRVRVMVPFLLIALAITGTLVFIGRRRKAYRVQCEKCSSRTLRLSPPVWSDDS